MRCEFPMLTRCCFCFPLRLGLLVWAYIKTISCAIMFSMLVYMSIETCSRNCRINLTHIFTVQIPILALLLTDIIFHIIFILSAHKKEYRKMRVFFRYNIFSLVIYILGFTISTCLMFTDSRFMLAFILGLLQLAIFVWIIVIQIYVLILVRSEIVKLKRNNNFEFVNHAAEPDLPATKVDYVNAEAAEENLHY